MAGSSFFALLDDIAALLDDIAIMSKVAAKKSASVLSDDLAVNAEQVTGMKPDRELPVVWAVFKGSLINKAILVPSALVLVQCCPQRLNGFCWQEESIFAMWDMKRLKISFHGRNMVTQSMVTAICRKTLKSLRSMKGAR